MFTEMEEMKQMLQVVTVIAEEARIVRALTRKNHFSEWLHQEFATSADLSLQRLLHKQSDLHLRFSLDSYH